MTEGNPTSRLSFAEAVVGSDKANSIEVVTAAAVTPIVLSCNDAYQRIHGLTVREKLKTPGLLHIFAAAELSGFDHLLTEASSIIYRTKDGILEWKKGVDSMWAIEEKLGEAVRPTRSSDLQGKRVTAGDVAVDFSTRKLFGIYSESAQYLGPFADSLGVTHKSGDPKIVTYEGEIYRAVRALDRADEILGKTLKLRELILEIEASLMDLCAQATHNFGRPKRPPGLGL